MMWALSGVCPACMRRLLAMFQTIPSTRKVVSRMVRTARFSLMGRRDGAGG